MTQHIINIISIFIKMELILKLWMFGLGFDIVLVYIILML